MQASSKAPVPALRNRRKASCAIYISARAAPPALKKKKKKISCGAGRKSASLPLSAVKWHKSLSSSSEAIKPQEPVKLQPSRPCLIKPTAIKTKTGLIPTLRVSSVSRRMDTSHIKMSLWVFSDVNTRMGIRFQGWRPGIRAQALRPDVISSVNTVFSFAPVTKPLKLDFAELKLLQ